MPGFVHVKGCPHHPSRNDGSSWSYPSLSFQTKPACPALRAVLAMQSKLPVAHCEPVPGVGQPKYQPQSNMMQQNVPQPNMQYVQQQVIYPSAYPGQQNIHYGGGAHELLSSNSCQCQSTKEYKGVFRFPNNGRLRLHCCACQSHTILDTREMLFPPSNNAVIETSGCQQRLTLFHSADVSVSSNLGGCQSNIRASDKRPAEVKQGAQPFVGRHITVTQSGSCCVCQSSVVATKLHLGQKPPAACVIS